MLRFVLRRLLWAIPTLLIVTFIVFLAIRLGTDPVESYKRANPNVARRQPQKIDEYIEINGLWEGPGGYVRGYWHWLQGFITGDWPRSIKGNTEVWPILKDALVNSARLAVVTFIVGSSVGISLGVVAALRPGKLRDSVVNTGALVAISIPPFVSAILLQLVFAVLWADWFGEPLFPTSGIYPPGHKGFDLFLMAKHMVLPVLVVVIQTIAVYSRYMRASLLEVLNSEYMRTARAKGISERRVLVRHALRNALIPVTTLAALELGGLAAGLIITENIFSYPGMGVYFLRATSNGDFPQLMPWMVVVVVFVIAFNLLADLSYAWLDPRIRLD